MRLHRVSHHEQRHGLGGFQARNIDAAVALPSPALRAALGVDLEGQAILQIIEITFHGSLRDAVAAPIERGGEFLGGTPGLIVSRDQLQHFPLTLDDIAFAMAWHG